MLLGPPASSTSFNPVSLFSLNPTFPPRPGPFLPESRPIPSRVET